MVFAGPGEQATVTDYKGGAAAVVFDVAKLVRHLYHPSITPLSTSIIPLSLSITPLAHL